MQSNVKLLALFSTFIMISLRRQQQHVLRSSRKVPNRFVIFEQNLDFDDSFILNFPILNRTKIRSEGDGLIYLDRRMDGTDKVRRRFRRPGESDKHNFASAQKYELSPSSSAHFQWRYDNHFSAKKILHKQGAGFFSPPVAYVSEGSFFFYNFLYRLTVHSTALLVSDFGRKPEKPGKT